MSRNQQLEKILEARYELDYAPREMKAARWTALIELVDKAIHNTNVSRYELLSSIHDRYIEFKRERRKKEQVAISQRLQS